MSQHRAEISYYSNKEKAGTGHNVMVLLASPLNTTQKLIENPQNGPGNMMWWFKIKKKNLTVEFALLQVDRLLNYLRQT